MKNNEQNATKVRGELKKSPPDGGYGWVVLCSSFFISFLIDGIMYSFGLVIGPIKEHYELEDKVANSLTSLNTGFLFCSGPIVAGLTSTFGCRTVIMVGALVTSTLYFLCCFQPTIVPVMIFYGVIGGISTGCTYISSLIVIAEYFDKKIGTATGIVMAGSGVGSAVIPLMFEVINKNYDWKLTISIAACGILLCVILGSFLRPLNPASDSKKKAVELKNMNMTCSEGNELSVHEEKIVQTYLGSTYSLNVKEPFYERNKFLRLSVEILREMTNFELLIQNFGFLLITLSNLFCFTGFFLPYIYLPSIAEQHNLMEKPAILLSIIGILNIPFRLLYGIIADKRFMTPLNLNTLCVLVATVPFFFYDTVLQYSVWGQYLFAVLFAIGIAGMNSLTTAYLLDMVGLEKFGNATGIINLFRGFGCSVGPFIGGAIVDAFESKSIVFYFSGFCFLIGFCLTLGASMGEQLKSCCNKGSDESNGGVIIGNDSELDKNLLNNKSNLNA